MFARIVMFLLAFLAVSPVVQAKTVFVKRHSLPQRNASRLTGYGINYRLNSEYYEVATGKKVSVDYILRLASAKQLRDRQFVQVIPDHLVAAHKALMQRRAHRQKLLASKRTAAISRQFASSRMSLVHRFIGTYQCLAYGTPVARVNTRFVKPERLIAFAWRHRIGVLLFALRYFALLSVLAGLSWFAFIVAQYMPRDHIRFQYHELIHVFNRALPRLQFWQRPALRDIRLSVPTLESEAFLNEAARFAESVQYAIDYKYRNETAQYMDGYYEESLYIYHTMFDQSAKLVHVGVSYHPEFSKILPDKELTKNDVQDMQTGILEFLKPAFVGVGVTRQAGVFWMTFLYQRGVYEHDGTEPDERRIKAKTPEL